MKAEWIRSTIVLACTAIIIPGCSSDSAGSGGSDGSSGADGSGGITLPSAQMTVQSHLSESEFDSQDSGGDLQSLVQSLAADGFTTFLGAGRAEDSDGNNAIWAVYGNADGNEAGVVLACLADETCTSFSTSRNAAGDLLTSTSTGDSVSAPWSASPALIRDLVGQDHGGRTSTARGALTVADVPVVNLSRRRIVLANAFGAAQGVQLGSWESLAKSTGAFNDVVYAEYASANVLRDAIENAAPADVLIWVGASVREKLGNEYKTVGMTANRAMYGDVTVRGVDEIRQWLKDSPYGGPGLVVLVGAETHGDGGSQANNPAAIFGEFSDVDTHRIVVAVQGGADAATILAASEACITAFLGGESLRAALDSGTAVFEAAGSTAKLVTNREGTADQITFPGALDAFFGDAPPKDPVRSNLYLNVANVCIDSSTGDGYSEEEGQVNFFVDVTFDGPFFSGSRNWEVDGEPLQAQVEGVMLGRAPGSGVYLTFTGDVKPSVKGLTIWGSGEVEDRSDIDNPNRVFFDGTVLATEYKNAKGDTCQLKSPTLSGSTSEQLSWIDFDLPK